MTSYHPSSVMDPGPSPAEGVQPAEKKMAKGAKRRKHRETWQWPASGLPQHSPGHVVPSCIFFGTPAAACCRPPPLTSALSVFFVRV